MMLDLINLLVQFNDAKHLEFYASFKLVRIGRWLGIKIGSKQYMSNLREIYTLVAA